MIEIQFTAVVIAALVGTFLTLFFAYFPRVRVWFASLAPDKASLLKLGIMLTVMLILGGLSYVPGLLLLKPPFNLETAITVAFALIVTNAPVSALLPYPTDVREAMRIRTAKYLKG